MTRGLTLYPAIDLKGGRCVRLLRGRMEEATIYNDDPAGQAEAFAAMGFGWLHIVDLDGAAAGRAENVDAVRNIVARTTARRQLGGGLRSLEAIEFWLDAGIDRIILGAAAVRDPNLVAIAAKRFQGRIVLGLDALEGTVRIDAWTTDTGLAAVDLARRYEDAGAAAIIYTDISRDGALTGANVEATAALAEAISIPVIASGGVAGAADIAALAEASDKIEGVILGKALYESRITAETAFAAAER
ncbi:MAG: 1-(5-phosphoribosyl)-5-[(5-phosphoribosylamino)methylideneamino]imidazole-4-carboxamide isomerase [Parvularculaceae bacterium]